MSLAVLANQMASKGRNGDSMLVHMSPSEVQALQALAEKHGTSLTINPETGQPEAFSLSSLLPMIAGIALGPAGFGLMSAGMAGAAVGGVTALATGSLSRGLMAGLGAYGGAGLGEALAGAGSSTLAGEAANAAYGTTSAMTDAAAQELGFKTAEEAAQNAAAQAAKSFDPAAVSSVDKLSAGLGSVASSPSSAMEFAKANWKPLAAAASPIMADAMVPTTTKAPQLDTGNIRKFSYDPYGQTYTPQGIFPAAGYKGMADGGIVALANGGVSDQQVKDWLAANPSASDTQISAAMQQYGVSPTQMAQVTGIDPAQVQQRYETAIAPQIVGQYTEGVAGPNATTAKAGSGYLGIYNQLQQAGVSPEELYAANSQGWTQPQLTHAYDVASKTLAFDPVTDSTTPADKEWVNFMDSNKFTTKDIAQATGLSLDEVQRRYDAAKKAGNQQNLAGGVGTTNTYTGGFTTTPQTYAPPGTSNPYGNAINPGDLTKKADGSVTVQPNIPGRPYGGFTGIGQLTDAYTAGGGSLGQQNLFVPQTVDQMNARYGNTGGSQQAYDYLMGKGAASTQKPWTPTGEVMKPYTEAVMGMPTNLATKKYIFDQATRTYKLNPDYQPLSYDSQGNRVLGASSTQLNTAINKGDAAVQALVDAGTADYSTIAAMLGITVADAQKRFPKKTTTVATTSATGGAGDGGGGASGSDGAGASGSGSSGSDSGGGMSAARGGVMHMALGGLGALAGGGQAQYNLGSYSDGGRLLKGPGDGVSDSIPATIGDKQPARLADGEFVVPARIVSELGNGSTDAGARKLYAMMDRVQKARGKTTGKGRVANDTRADKYLPA